MQRSGLTPITVAAVVAAAGVLALLWGVAGARVAAGATPAIALLAWLAVLQLRRGERRCRYATECQNRTRARDDHAVIESDLRGIVTAVSDKAERLLGYRREELIGHPADIWPDADEVALRAEQLGVNSGLAAFVHAVRAGSSETRDWTFVRADRRRISVSLTVSGIRGEHGRLVGYCGLIQDRTDSYGIGPGSGFDVQPDRQWEREQRAG